MSWSFEYHPAAHWGLLHNIGPDAAARVDHAVMDLAATGRGALEQVAPDDPNRFRLRVEGAEARLFIDRKARTILVTRVYRRR